MSTADVHHHAQGLTATSPAWPASRCSPPWRLRAAVRWPRANPAPAWAALTLAVYWACGVVPVQLATVTALGLATSQAESFMFAVWALGGLCSLTCALVHRQPIVVSTSFSALLYVGTLSGRFGVDELIGANIMAAAIMAALGLFGLTARILAVLPASLIMGTFAGTFFGALSRLVTISIEDGAIAGVTIVGYLVGRTLRSPYLPPVGLAALFGGVGVLLSRPVDVPPIEWSVPAVVPIEPRFSLGALLGISLPVVVLATSLGHVRSVAFLRTQGYRVPLDRVTAASGAASVVAALFGGAPLSIGAEPSAILGSSEAGPRQSRYVGAVIVAVFMLAISATATSLVSLFQVLPASYLVALLGVALLAPAQNALTVAVDGSFGPGGLVAFVVALTPFTIAGMPSPIWALAAGLVTAAATAPEALLASWGRGSPDASPA